jgi:uncharacterized protein (DUF885 family)
MPRRNRNAAMIGFVLQAALCGACFAQEAGKTGAAAEDPWPCPASDLENWIRRYAVDSADLLRFYDLPWSEECRRRAEEFDRDADGKLRDISFDALNAQGKIDYLLLRRHLSYQAKSRARGEQRLAEMAELLPFREGILKLELARRRMEKCDPRQAAGVLADMPERLKELRKRYEPAPAGATQPAATQPNATQPAATLAPVTALRAAAATDALRGVLETWYGAYGDFQPDFAWWIKEPYDKTCAALTDYAKFLRETSAGVKGADDDPLIGQPIGQDALAAELEHEFLTVSPRDLIAIGERELAWCETEMKKAAGEMGLGEDWKAALERVKNDYVPPGRQGDLVKEEGRAAVDFLKQNDLITIPPLCEETWDVQMLSLVSQKMLPFAAYGGQKMLVAYPTADMPYAEKLMSMRGNNRYFTRLITPHELIPGHHMQAFMAERYRPYRSMFATPFFGEGWALYWELTLWEQGYGRTPEERIGMLFWRMHRAARIVVSLKFHLGEMTPAEMIQYLMERVGHERLGATSEVRRFIGDDYSPLYQCGYLIGGLQLRALRREVLAAKLMSVREFHDRLLTYGAIPIALIRADLLGLPLTPDVGSDWDFAAR